VGGDKKVWEVAVAIPTYGGWNLVKRLLASLNTRRSYTVVIVEGLVNPSEEERRWVEENEAILEVGVVGGVARAFNVGIKRGLEVAEYVYLVNDDCILHSKAVDELIDFWERKPHPDIVAVSSQVLNMTDGFKVEDLDRIYSEVVGGVRPEWVYGWHANACLWTRELVEKVGMFDENFKFACYDDDDVRIRIGKAGFRSAISNRSLVWHQVSATLDRLLKDNPSLREEVRRNLLYLLKKHPEYEWYFKKHLEAL
jgi:GT2 family glycosyltransferase